MLDNASALHLANRLGFGPAAGEIERIKSLGFDAYLEEQLHPNVNALPPALLAQLQNLGSHGKSTVELYKEYWFKALMMRSSDGKSKKEQKSLLKKVTNEVGPEARMARLARAIASPHRLHEVLVDFWFNHFNVYEHKKLARVWIGAYEDEAIRPNVFGKFKDLLLATAKHPAMLVYLDNWRNVAPGARAHGKSAGINENYAREVMELHTLGVEGGYTQQDVTALAHILTGWTVGKERDAVDSDDSTPEDDREVRGNFAFAARWHDSTPQTFLGRRFNNAGQEDGVAALLMLAEHPATVNHISFKLAQYFVADSPPEPLLKEMATTFTGTGGDLREVTRVMLTSKSFRDPSSAGQKFKTPYQYVVSVARLSGLDPHNAAPLAEELKALGQPIYGCVSPDGYACTQSAWLDPDAMIRRLSFAVKFGSGAYNQAYLARAGYGAMNKQIHLQPAEGGTPLNPERLLHNFSGDLSAKTKAAIAQASGDRRAGLLLGSPEFMRC